mmetsp:Transcript_14449/g.41381  ORF Transcript_14449/g.41381 Transcript_14449/m.41381 type:complete len:326 (+) Transcript_14449:1878-2855(+)
MEKRLGSSTFHISPTTSSPLFSKTGTASFSLTTPGACIAQRSVTVQQFGRILLFPTVTDRSPQGTALQVRMALSTMRTTYHLPKNILVAFGTKVPVQGASSEQMSLRPGSASGCATSSASATSRPSSRQRAAAATASWWWPRRALKVDMLPSTKTTCSRMILPFGPAEIPGRPGSPPSTPTTGTRCGASTCRSGTTTRRAAPSPGTSSCPTASAAPRPAATATCTSSTGAARPTVWRLPRARWSPARTQEALLSLPPSLCLAVFSCSTLGISWHSGTRSWSWIGWKRLGLPGTSVQTRGSGCIANKNSLRPTRKRWTLPSTSTRR